MGPSSSKNPMLQFPFKLDRFQADAIRYLDQGRSVLVCAPTGTGKTLIADHLVAASLEAGRHIVYTAPVKALSNQKFRDWRRLFGEERVGLITGDLVIRRDAPCRVMTTEILRNMLLAGEDLSSLSHVVLDEIHFLDDRERGTVWEELLIYLPREVQILGLSATLSNLEEFADWLSDVRGSRVEVVRETRRAVPLELLLFQREHGLVTPKDFDRLHKQCARKARPEPVTPARGRPARQGGRGGSTPRGPTTSHLDVFERMKKGFLPYLYFVFNRAATERFAQQLAQTRPQLLDARERESTLLLLTTFEADHPKVLGRNLRDMIERGVAFHHAGLNVLLKALVEELYERKLLKVLYCTSTFALGINMPARAVVLDGLHKFDGQQTSPLTVRQFMQKAGRAGRRGMDDVGYVAVRIDHESWEECAPLMQRYLSGAPEKVRSAFNLSFNSVVCLLDRHSPERIRDLLQRSFLCYRLARESNSEAALAKRLDKEIRTEWHLADDGDLPSSDALPPPLRRKARERQRLLRRVEERGERCWQDFEMRVGFLQSVGYLGEDLSFEAGARVLMHVQIAEIFVTEMFLRGIFEDTDPPTFFGLLCGIVQDLGRGVEVRYWPDEDTRRLARRVEAVLRDRAVRGADRILGLETTFTQDMIIFGQGWARGQSLAELMRIVDSVTDISGDLVGAFRRARDLVGQMLPLYDHDPTRQEALRRLLRETGRDEVEVVD
jgi:superfamily II RNA helicase